MICVEISMVVGIFVGEWGELVRVRIRWGKRGVKALGLLGRAWVSSLPKFFLGNSFHFWKLPPLFCINSRDNVYYPIFLGSIWYTVLTLEYTENCIVSVPASVKTLS